MPFESQAQRGWMFKNHPEMAERWAKETPKGKKLPKHKSKKLAAALQKQQLIPGAPPVDRIATPQPQPGQPPQPQAASGIPQQPTAQIPQMPTAATQTQQQPPAPAPAPMGPKAPLTAQQVQAPKQQNPNAIVNSEAIIGDRLSKMAAVTYQRLLAKRLHRTLAR